MREDGGRGEDFETFGETRQGKREKREYLMIL